MGREPETSCRGRKKSKGYLRKTFYIREDDVNKMNHVLELFGKKEPERPRTKVILLSNTKATQLLGWKNKRNDLISKKTFPNLKRYK